MSKKIKSVMAKIQERFILSDEQVTFFFTKFDPNFSLEEGKLSVDAHKTLMSITNTRDGYAGFQYNYQMEELAVLFEGQIMTEVDAICCSSQDYFEFLASITNNKHIARDVLLYATSADYIPEVTNALAYWFANEIIYAYQELYA